MRNPNAIWVLHWTYCDGRKIGIIKGGPFETRAEAIAEAKLRQHRAGCDCKFTPRKYVAEKVVANV